MPHSDCEPRAPISILVVDDDPSVCAHIAALVDGRNHRVIEANDAEWALELYQRHQPDLVFSDIVMAGNGGYWLARQIRAHEARHGSVWTPIIFLSGLSSEADVAEGVAAGGDDYVVKPIHPVVLEAKIQTMSRLRDMHRKLLQLSAELRQANAELQRQNEHDPLTGLLNRRGLTDRLDAALRHAQRLRTPLTVALCDVDFFKNYNDRLGHPAGDDCLRRVGTLLRHSARRPDDAVARYGGEEFALVLPETPGSSALSLSQSLTRVFAAAALPHPASTVAAHVTISGGMVTVIPDQFVTGEALLRAADEALYVAKSGGRNRFVTSMLGAELTAAT